MYLLGFSILRTCLFDYELTSQGEFKGSLALRISIRIGISKLLDPSERWQSSDHEATVNKELLRRRKNEDLHLCDFTFHLCCLGEDFNKNRKR